MLNLPWWLWGCAALVVSALFALLGPSNEGSYLLRYGHAAVWLLLSLACFVARLPLLAQALAACAGLLYLLFIAALISSP